MFGVEPRKSLMFVLELKKAHFVFAGAKESSDVFGGAGEHVFFLVPPQAPYDQVSPSPSLPAGLPGPG